MPAKGSGKLWMTIHLYVSMFFLPVAMIYAITGGLEIFGYHGSARERTIDVALVQALPEAVEVQEAFIADQLKKHNLPVPRGRAQIRRGRFAWGRSTAYNVTLRTEPGLNLARIRIETPSLYNRLALMHEAQGGMVFNTLAVAFAAALILIYISGILICWKSVKLRKTMVLSLSLGLLTTIIAVLLSM